MTNTEKKPVVGFIGLGIMGCQMAGHILAADYPLHVFNRTKAKANTLLEKGAHWHDTPGAVAAEADIVITMVGLPSDVEQVYLGADGIIERARAGSVLIDMTTSSPALAERIAAQAAAKGLQALDAPVSGGDVGAREARLSIMVGGPQSALDKVMPVLAVMGKNIVLQGGPGAGQHTKMANQIIVACNMMGVCEGIAYASAAGLDPQTVLKSVSGGAAASFIMQNNAQKILDRDFSAVFFLEHFLKDLGIALAEAATLKRELPGVSIAKRMYDQLAANGQGRNGTQTLYKCYDGSIK